MVELIETFRKEKYVRRGIPEHNSKEAMDRVDKLAFLVCQKYWRKRRIYSKIRD